MHMMTHWWYSADSIPHCKGIYWKLRHRGGGSEGSSPTKASNLQFVEYGPAGMEKNKYRSCTVPSQLNPSRARCSIPDNASTSEAGCPRKVWSSLLERISGDIPALSSSVTCNQADRSTTSLSGSRLVSSTSPTNQGRKEGLGVPMVAMVSGQQESIIWRRHRLPRGLCLGGNRFFDPSQRNLIKVAKP